MNSEIISRFLRFKISLPPSQQISLLSHEGDYITTVDVSDHRTFILVSMLSPNSQHHCRCCRKLNDAFHRKGFTIPLSSLLTCLCIACAVDNDQSTRASSIREKENCRIFLGFLFRVLSKISFYDQLHHFYKILNIMYHFLLTQLIFDLFVLLIETFQFFNSIKSTINTNYFSQFLFFIALSRE